MRNGSVSVTIGGLIRRKAHARYCILGVADEIAHSRESTSSLILPLKHPLQRAFKPGTNGMKQTFDTILNAVTSESELSPRTLKLMSLLFLTIAASLCFLTYTKTVVSHPELSRLGA